MLFAFKCLLNDHNLFFYIELVITEGTTKLDNVPFNQSIVYDPEEDSRPKRKCK